MIHLERVPELNDGVLILGFRGLMDGGEVSTGTVEYLIETYDAERFGEIHPDGYYVYSVPGALQIAAMFRPHAQIEDGRVTDYEEPRNEFYVSEQHNAVLFIGDEPHISWHQYTRELFSIVEQCNISRICYVGSVTGLVPHTREPVFYSSFSDESFRDAVVSSGIHPTHYEGPSSLATFFIKTAEAQGISIATLVAGIPPYVQGRNDHCIESLIEKLQPLLGIYVDTDELAARRVEFDRGLEDIVQARPELREQIKKLEDIYDQQLNEPSDDSGDTVSPSEPDIGDIRSWFDKQGFSFDG
ncbi:MAG: PAC2 family protein [Candidatus Hydrogenedentota bacterium]